MRIDLKKLLAPAVGALVFLVTLQQTLSALKSSGAWQPRPRATHAKPPDPYARLDLILARPLLGYPPERRDPFGTPVPLSSPVAHTPGPPPTPLSPAGPQPVLTSIIWDSDPRATIRFNDRDFSVRENSLFADFRVKTITSRQVVLEREGEPLVLTLRLKGE